MADKIERLGKFMEAAKKEFVNSANCHFYDKDGQPKPDSLGDHIGWRINCIISDEINEAEYINQWVKE